MGPKKRKATDITPMTASTPPKRRRSSAVDLPGGDPPKRPTRSAKMRTTKPVTTHLSTWFEHYKDEDGLIGPDGMTQFCEDLGISLESIEILIVARKLNAKNMGFFTKDEWLDGMRRMEVDSTEKLKMRLPELRLAYEKPAEFRDLYMFAFDFAKENDARKYLSLELATGLWNLLMPPDKHAHVSKFLTFLSEEKPVQAINKDQWKSFLDFSETVKEDLTGYDETSAWPVLFDDYVTWRYRADA